MRIRDLRVPPHLCVEDLTLGPGEVWCVLGENGAGKSLLGRALAGELPEAAGHIEGRPERVVWTSFESQQALYEADLDADDSNFLGGGAHGWSALDVVLSEGGDEATVRDLAARLGIGHLLERMLRQLSTGEARRVMLLRALASAPDLLILDEPFEGLDPISRDGLAQLLAQLADSGQGLMLLVNREADITPFVTHLAVMRGGRVVLQGPRAELQASGAYRDVVHAELPTAVIPPPPDGEAGTDDAPRFDPLVVMRACSVRYGEVIQLAPFDWTLRAGDHTLIIGDNGSGKSTLLQLITGDHPQCYTNDLHVFGYRRGSGESIWDIKRHIGLVSPALHRDYRVGASALEVVISGLYDSIGLYQQPRPSDLDAARAWLELMRLSDAAQTPLRELSYGLQRLVLIARALIKQPPLVILDEPTQGLDDDNRRRVLGFIEQLSGLSRTTLLFVSHRSDEHLPLFRSRLQLERSVDPGVRYVVRVG